MLRPRLHSPLAQMLIHGGAGDNHYYGDTWLLHLAQRRWTQVLVETDFAAPSIAPPPAVRFSHSATAVNGGQAVVLFGG